MKHGKWLLALIIVSLAFNFAFLGGFVYHRWLLRRPPAPLREFKDTRRTELKEKMESFFEANKPYMKEYRESRRLFIESLRKEHVDLDASRRLMEAAIERQMDMERRVGEHFIEMRKEMTAQEAEQFFRHMTKDQQDMKGGPHVPNSDSRYPRGPVPPDGPHGPRDGF